MAFQSACHGNFLAKFMEMVLSKNPNFLNRFSGWWKPFDFSTRERKVVTSYHFPLTKPRSAGLFWWLTKVHLLGWFAVHGCTLAKKMQALQGIVPLEHRKGMEIGRRAKLALSVRSFDRIPARLCRVFTWNTLELRTPPHRYMMQISLI